MWALNFFDVLMLPGSHKTCPRFTSSLFKPRHKAPMLSPASPRSNSFLNISTPVQVVLVSMLKPKISSSSPTLTTPCSTRPVTTVPRPEIEKTSSTGIKKGLSKSRTGSGTVSSTVCINSKIASRPRVVSLPSAALRADPRMMGVSSSKPYISNNSRISISTNSNNSSSSSSIISHLLRNTTNLGMPTCLANRMCSRVWGMGPSVAATTRIAPSIWAAPVIIFLT
mmetsp:Transcript_21051/g.29273  ORF Transcript_21051/g.29273 Transcript_21051/m.29273 type:complete len:225 (+) Transcript_21051:441-1115(+)